LTQNTCDVIIVILLITLMGVVCNVNCFGLVFLAQLLSSPAVEVVAVVAVVALHTTVLALYLGQFHIPLLCELDQ
jgi:hypothetical protein